MKKLIYVVIIVGIVGAFGYQIYRKVMEKQKAGNPTRPKPIVSVEISPISTMTVRDVHTYTGSLIPLSLFYVAPKISGRLEKLEVNIGDSIKKGKLIALIDDAEYVQQVEQAKAELEVARTTLEEAKLTLDISRRELERLKSLRDKKIISESELDSNQKQFNTVQARYKAALEQVAHRESVLKSAQIRLSYTRIHATWNNGDTPRVIGERFVNEGDMIAPNTPLISVLDISKVIAVIHVIERDYSKIQINQKVQISTDGVPNRYFLGKVVRIAPFLKEETRDGRVEIEIDNPDYLLKPGMFVRAEIEFEVKENATVVPLSALVKRDGQSAVFLADIENRKAIFTPVTTGIIDKDWIEIISPKLTGSVIVLGQHLLDNGSSIMIPQKEVPKTEKPSTSSPKN